MSRLQVQDLSVRFGGVQALDSVTISVDDGELVGLIGPNGAGKTTFIDAVCGFVPATGTINFSGADLAGLAPHRRAQQGLARTWQGGELFEDLSVGDNVRVALEQRVGSFMLADFCRFNRLPQREEVDRVLEAVGLTEHIHDSPETLPHGKRKLVGVARAIAARAKFIFLDEPAAGLSTLETDALAACLDRVRQAGIGLLLVEHDVRLVADVCDRVYVLDRGALLAQGLPSEVLRDQAVIDAYLGPTAEALVARVASAATPSAVAAPPPATSQSTTSPPTSSADMTSALTSEAST